MTVKVLAFDGGGVVSLFSLWMIERIQQERPDFLTAVDVFAGTSSGGICSLLLAGSESREDGLAKAIDFWFENPISISLARTAAALSGCVSMYSNASVKKLLRPLLGSQTLGDLKRRGERVVVPAFDLEGPGPGGDPTWKPKVFHNLGADDEPDLAELAFDVALRTSAAPVFFPVVDGYVDGGLFANNPSLCAVAQVMAKPLSAARRNRGVAAADVRLLSVGTGRESSFLKVVNAPWGYRQWLLDPRRPLALVEAFFEAGMLAVDYQCATVLEDGFFRLNPPLADAGLAGLDLEDNFVAREHPLFATIRDRLRQAVAPDSRPGWLGDAIDWLERVGWVKPRDRSAESAP